MRRAATTAAAMVIVLLGAAGCSYATDDENDATLPATEAELAFLQDMADHHAQAVLMANFVSRHGADERVRGLAFDISTSQAEERGRIAALLEDRGSGPGDPNRPAMADMPGMISSADLADLQNLDGDALDRRFLELMQVHHEGGVAMAEAAQEEVDDPRIADLAGLMLVSQQEELTDLALLSGPAS